MPEVVPVAEAVRQQVALGLRAEVVHVALHRRPRPRQRLAVAVPAVEEPGQDDPAAAPLRRVAEAPLELHVLGRDVGNEPVLGLGVHDVGDLLAVEAEEVVVEVDGLAHEVGLLEPAQLLAVRAVGQDAREVAADRPAHQGVDPVEERERGLEAARLGRGVAGVRHLDRDDAGQSGRPVRARGHGALDLDVAEAVVGEAGRPGLLAPAAQRVGPAVGLARGLLVGPPVGRQQLGGRERHRAAALAPHAEPHDARGVLAEVVEDDARADRLHAHRPQRLHDPQRVVRLDLQPAGRRA